MSNLIDTDAKEQGERQDGFGQAHVVKMSTGRIYVSHITTANDVEVHYSDNQGQDWSLDVTFAGIVNPHHLSMCVSELDDIFLCFNKNTGSPYNLVVKRRDHTLGTWSEVRIESVSMSGSWIPNGIITYNRALNRLHLVWINNTSGFVIVSRYSDDKGVTWSSLAGYTWGSGNVEGRLYGIHTHPSTGSIYCFGFIPFWGVRSEILNSAGSRIGSEGSISNTVYAGAIAIDSSGNRWRVWYERDGSNNYHLKADKNGSGNLDVNYSSTDALKTGMVTIGIDGADNVFIFYVKKTDSKCYYRKYDYQTVVWETEQVFTMNDGLRPSCEQHSLITENKLNVVFYTIS